MTARRALLEDQADELAQSSLAAFQVSRPRRALIEDENLTNRYTDDIAAASAFTMVESPVDFEPEDALVTTTQIPRFTERVSAASEKTKTRIRRTAAALATAIAAGTLVVLPHSVNAVTTQQVDQALAAHDETKTNDNDDIVAPMTGANAALNAKQDELSKTFADDSAREAAAAEEAARKAEEEAKKAEEERACQEAQNTQAQAQTQTSSASQPVIAAPPASGSAGAAVSYALAQVGKPYNWGAVGPDSYDCSGLVLASYASAGVSLPRTSYAMATVGSPVPLDQMQPGDIVIAYGGGHAAMYIGNGQIVHAADYGIGVIVSSLDPGSITAVRRVA